MLKVINTVKKTNDQVSDPVLQGKVLLAYTERKTRGHTMKQGKEEILTNPGIEHHPACALNEREVLWEKLVCDHVIQDFTKTHIKREGA